MVPYFGMVAQLLLAAIFVLSSLSKARRPADFAATLSGLGLPSAAARLGALAVIAAEFVIGVVLSIAPEMAWPRVAVTVFAFLFAGAGVWALRTGRRLACACFGPGHSSVLGWRQILALPLWLVLVATAQLAGGSWDTAQGLAAVAGVLLLAGLAGLVRLTPMWRVLRADRAALR